jgi:hypothetical protein
MRAFSAFTLLDGTAGRTKFRSLPDRPRCAKLSYKIVILGKAKPKSFTTEDTEFAEKKRRLRRFGFKGLALFLAAGFDHFAVGGEGLFGILRAKGE